MPFSWIQQLLSFGYIWLSPPIYVCDRVCALFFPSHLKVSSQYHDTLVLSTFIFF